jgi:hypothetical protein
MLQLILFIKDFIMEFFLAIALGVGTYHDFLEVLHYPEEFSNDIGWIVGLITLIIGEYLKKQIKHKRRVELIKAEKAEKSYEEKI